MELHELVFYKEARKDAELVLEGLKSLKNKTVGETLTLSPHDEANYRNRKRIEINLPMVTTELTKSINLANTLYCMFEVNMSIPIGKNDEDIILIIQAQFYPRFYQLFQGYPDFLNQYKDLEEALKNGKPSFSIIVANRNIRNEYKILEPIYNEPVLSFKEKEYNNMSIVLDANDIQFEETSI